MEDRQQADPDAPDPQAPKPADPDAPDSEPSPASPAKRAEPAPEAASEVAESAELAVDSLRDELDIAKERALRVQAELENYRKRVARERADEHRYANMPLLRNLLPVLDNLDRAIAAAEQTHDATTLLEGVKLVREQLAGVLAKHDCVPIEAEGQPFDPHRHEAILQQPSDEVPANTVTQVAQSGYQLHDRVVRAAQVIVSAGPENQGENED